MKETKNHSFDDEPLNAWFKGSSDHIPPESNHSIRKANDLTTNARAVCTKVKCLPELADKTANLGISAVKIILAVFIITFMHGYSSVKDNIMKQLHV